jgi:rod shape-determining protein MreC
MRFFSRDADVRVGDEVLTSGVGSVYPAGLLIGYVTEVYVPQPGLVKECYVRPAVDFAHLEEVLVMIE